MSRTESHAFLQSHPDRYQTQILMDALIAHDGLHGFRDAIQLACWSQRPRILDVFILCLRLYQLDRIVLQYSPPAAVNRSQLVVYI
jgi:hypothetical protein